MTIVALQAAAELEKEDISCEVVDLRTLTPLDTRTIISSVEKTGRAIVVEECCGQAGLGGDIAYRIHHNCFETLLAPVTRVSGLDVPMPYSRKIEKLCIPQVNTVSDAVRSIIYEETKEPQCPIF
jgi:pyruvate dehydrogenase E1 component beta subunit